MQVIVQDPDKESLIQGIVSQFELYDMTTRNYIGM